MTDEIETIIYKSYCMYCKLECVDDWHNDCKTAVDEYEQPEKTHIDNILKLKEAMSLCDPCTDISFNTFVSRIFQGVKICKDCYIINKLLLEEMNNNSITWELRYGISGTFVIIGLV